MEQTALKERTTGSRVICGLILALAILFALMGLFFAANILGISEGGALEISWHSAIGCVLTLASAAVLWRFKDGLYTEYDYAIRDGRIYVSAVLNNRRRVPKLNLELGRVQVCGIYDGRSRGRLEKLYPDSGDGLIYICYEDKGEKRMALLALNDDMTAALRRGIQRGAWRDAEGKN